MNKEFKKILGKDLEYVAIDKLQTGEIIISIHEQMEKKCIAAMQKIEVQKVIVHTQEIEFLKDPVFKEVTNISVCHIVKNLKPLQNLTKLTHLSLSSLQPADLDFSKFEHLKFLNCNLKVSKTNIEVLEHLEELYLFEFSANNLMALSKLANLKKLALENATITSLDGIATLNKLKSLYIHYADNLTSIEEIAFLNANLNVLELSSASLTKLNPINKLSNLKELSLHHFDKIDDLSFLANLPNLTDFSLYRIRNINSLAFITNLYKTQNLFLSPWDVVVADNDYLPVTKKLVALGKLNQIIEWENIINHLDDEGKNIYDAHFGVSKLQCIKRDFKFYNYDDYSEPYTKKNCDAMDKIIHQLIEQLEQNSEVSETEKISYFKIAVENINKIDDEIDGFVSTGERELLCDTLDEIAIAVEIDINKFEDGIASLWRTW